MNPILKNIIAVVIGWLGGSIINMGLIQIGHKLIPINGVDPTDRDALIAAMSDLGAEHMIFPFLAHALGTLTGALIAAIIAANHKMKFALGIGVLFLIGGIVVSFMIPAPTWFTVTDIMVAYIPMAWVGGKLALRLSKRKGEGS